MIMANTKEPSVLAVVLSSEIEVAHSHEFCELRSLKPVLGSVHCSLVRGVQPEVLIA